MTSLTLPPVPITLDIASAFSKDHCDDISHGNHRLQARCTVKKCILVKRDTHRWAIVHDDEATHNLSKLLYRWHSRYEAPVSMRRLASEDDGVAARERATLVAIAALRRERNVESQQDPDGRDETQKTAGEHSDDQEVVRKCNENQNAEDERKESQEHGDRSNESHERGDTASESSKCDQLTATSTEDSDVIVPSPTPAISSKEATNVQLTVEKALKVRARKNENARVQIVEPSGLEDAEDWEFVNAERIDRGWLWV